MHSQLNPYALHALSFEPQKHYEMSLGPYFDNLKQNKNKKNPCIKPGKTHYSLKKLVVYGQK